MIDKHIHVMLGVWLSSFAGSVLNNHSIWRFGGTAFGPSAVRVRSDRMSFVSNNALKLENYRTGL